MAWDESKPVAFPQWKSVLAAAPVDDGAKAAYSRGIIGFLRFCKEHHDPRNGGLGQSLSRTLPGKFERRRSRRSKVVLPKNALKETRPLSGSASLPVRRTSAGPPPARSDLGGASWEQTLVRACRERGFLWRTEETYRMWGQRFATFIHPRKPDTAGNEEVTAFLSSLAVGQRASASTQRQALNALVFLIQEGFKRDLGEMDFKRSRPGTRVPSVLTRDECSRLFAAMDGTPRLMAETMYGAGLRLMELLRLRIHHLDFNRGQIVIRGGKGDRVNGGADAVPELN